MSTVNLSNLSAEDLYRLRWARWKARTDLGWLCREVLNYPDVSDELHGPVIKTLQRFPYPDDKQFCENDKIVNGKWVYKPITPMTKLPGGRKVLLLDPRGHLKTTINAQSHTIQWTINYPDIALMIVQSNSDKAEMILGEIKAHFQANPKFRALFPEHCPTKKIFDWGTKAEFTTEARSHDNTRKESTVMTGSIDKGSAGLHFDVMKFSDIVEPNNSRTPDQLQAVIRSYYMMENLLVGPNYWIDIEGTRYDFGDLYGTIIDAEKVAKPEDREWTIHARGCYKKDFKGQPETYTPETLDLPELKTEKGELIPIWPERFSYKNLEAKRRADSYIFSCQQLNNPIGGDPNSIPFPINDSRPTWITRENFKNNVRILYRDISVDTAETNNARSNNSVLSVGGWDAFNRCYVEEIVAGKFMPDELARKIIVLTLKYQPRSVKIEETSFVRGFMFGLNRLMHTMNVVVPVELIKRDNQVSKNERILNTLQPWYKSGDLRFLDDLGPKELLLAELKQFPRGKSDDVLDSLADLYQGKTWLGRERPRPTFQQEIAKEFERWLGLEDPYSTDAEYNAGGALIHDALARTGGM